MSRKGSRWVSAKLNPNNLFSSLVEGCMSVDKALQSHPLSVHRSVSAAAFEVSAMSGFGHKWSISPVRTHRF